MPNISISSCSIITTILLYTGVLRTHPTSQKAVEGSTAQFKCVIKNCPSCLVHWTATDIETNQPLNTTREVTEEGKFLTSTLSIVAVRTTVVQCEEYNRFAERKSERVHYSKYAVLLVEGEGRYTNSTMYQLNHSVFPDTGSGADIQITDTAS